MTPLHAFGDDVLEDLDAVGLVERIQSGAVSVPEVVDAAIARVEARNPSLNAVVATRFEAALAEAGAGPAGPLAGVPFVVKDLGCDVAGLPSTRGSRLWADAVATDDSELARRYKAAGLVILGERADRMGQFGEQRRIVDRRFIDWRDEQVANGHGLRLASG